MRKHPQAVINDVKSVSNSACITAAARPHRRLWTSPTLQAHAQHALRTLCVIASLLPLIVLLIAPNWPRPLYKASPHSLPTRFLLLPCSSLRLCPLCPLSLVLAWLDPQTHNTTFGDKCGISTMASKAAKGKSADADAATEPAQLGGESAQQQSAKAADPNTAAIAALQAQVAQLTMLISAVLQPRTPALDATAPSPPAAVTPASPTPAATAPVTSTSSSARISYSTTRLETFEGRTDQDAERWLAKFDLLAASQQWDAPTRAMQLQLHLGGTADALVAALPESDRADYGKLRAAVRTLSPTRSAFVDRERLTSRKQQPAEPVELFAADVRTLCGRVNVSMTEDEMTGHLLGGLLPDLRRQLLLAGPTPTTFNAVVAEAQRIQLVLHGGPTSATRRTPTSPLPILYADPSHGHGPQRDRQDPRDRPHPRRPPPPNTRHESYQRNHAFTGRNLRASDGRPICNACDRVGHFATVCPERARRPPSTSPDATPPANRAPETPQHPN